jgi:poly-gamma-glutamate synthesis protein (capsule biosynthesis protein)
MGSQASAIPLGNDAITISRGGGERASMKSGEGKMTYEAQSGNFRMVALGDIIATRRLNVFQEEGFLKIRGLLRGGDCTFANLESPIHGFQFPPWPGKRDIGSCHPETVEDLKWLGINAISFANNHTCDWGMEGMAHTLHQLGEAKIRYAGAGMHLQDALMPGYLDTRRGRVALISATSTFEPGFRAVEQRPDEQGAPGVNCLGHSTSYTVDRQSFNELKRISLQLGHEAEKERRLNRLKGHPHTDKLTDSETRFHLYDRVFELGEGFQVNTKCNPRDLENNLKWVRTAVRQADWVLVSLHNHVEGGSANMPADFAIEFAHACLDAGAHAFFGSGPHWCWPVEIYKGKPIFYSLGNFVMQLETFARLPQDCYDEFDLGYDATPSDFYAALGVDDEGSFVTDPKYWRAIFSVTHWEEGHLEKIQLFPIDLGQYLPWSQRGRPVLADARMGREILEQVREISRPFGTEIEIENGIGTIRG